jgi:dolichol-phosphate mannosyltransferase
MSPFDDPANSALVIIPTYNERDCIQPLLDALPTSLGSRPLAACVVDDASPDGTANIVRQHPAFGHRIELLDHPHRMGFGPSYVSAFLHARDRGWIRLFQMDADGSHDPRDLIALDAALSEGADAVIGSRYLRGVRVLNWPIGRLMISLCASFYVRTLTALPLTDPTSGFKGFRREAIRAIAWETVRSTGYAFQIEVSLALHRAGWTLKEFPITFTDRHDGTSKMSRGIAIEAIFRVLSLALGGSARAQTKPKQR